MLLHHCQDQQRTGKTYGQSKYIDQGKDLIPDKNPGSYDNDISDHLVFILEAYFQMLCHLSQVCLDQHFIIHGDINFI
jgi:hypothetical protein